jgi:exopolyphosphatase / guanosine-5'-triphosphate,3'-diphosphate pyrophosphatase
VTIVPRWEWRTFGDSLGDAERCFDSLSPVRVTEQDDLYLLSAASDASVKVRNGLMDVKHLERVSDDGLEQWKPVMKAAFPLSAADVRFVLDSLRVTAPEPVRASYSLDELAEALARVDPGILAVHVHKRREHHTIGGCLAERAEMRTATGATRTIAVEAEDPGLVIAAVRELDLDSRPNVSVPRGLKALAGFGSRRYAVIDVGTNSIKLHIAERRPDGGWQRIVDRAEVTRLGEGLEESGQLGAAPIARSVAAVAAMVDEAGRNGAGDIAAVGTAGLRSATNGSEFVDAVRGRCGIAVEIISAEDERRLAYLGASTAMRSTGRSSSTAAATPTNGAGSWGCNQTGPRSSWPAPASSAPSWRCSGATR